MDKRPDKKLELHKETVRRLTEQELDQVAGGNTRGRVCYTHEDFVTFCPHTPCERFTDSC